MRIGIRIIVCVFTAAIALTFVVFTFAGFNRDSELLPAEGEGYILGEKDGSVAIFSSADPDTALSITNIELAQLRQSDRSLLKAGIAANSEEELLQLLEDLGS